MFKSSHILFALICFDKVLNSRNESDITSGKPISQTSCNIGWFSYGDMCYTMGDGRLSWEQASVQCRLDYNGNMVAIHSKELSDFVTVFFLLSVRQTLWIGLHDKVNESTYIWDDGSSMDFTNWAKGEPSGRSRVVEDCVELYFHNAVNAGGMGKWNDAKCDQKLPFICQKERRNFYSDYLDPRFCSSDLGGGWKHLTSCFHFVNESKIWLEAEEHCIEKFKGHLVTIPDWRIELFLKYIIGEQEKNVWIGIRMQNRNVQQWSSGWHVAYENWAIQHGVFIEGTCAARSKDEKWVNLSCNSLLPFVCEYANTVTPTLKPIIEDATCPDFPDGWKDLGGDYCYFFETKTYHNWHQANFQCLKRAGSSLISMHSQDEDKIFRNFIQFQQKEIYIGLYRQNNSRFAWTDGSPLDFTNWDANEPSSTKEECVEIRAINGKWNDVDCKQLRGYICSIPKVLPNQTHEQQEKSSACLNGFSSTTLVGVIFCVVFVAALIGVIIHYSNFFNKKYEHLKKISGTQFQAVFYRKPKDKSQLIVIEDA